MVNLPGAWFQREIKIEYLNPGLKIIVGKLQWESDKGILIGDDNNVGYFITWTSVIIISVVQK